MIIGQSAYSMYRITHVFHKIITAAVKYVYLEVAIICNYKLKMLLRCFEDYRALKIPTQQTKLHVNKARVTHRDEY